MFAAPNEWLLSAVVSANLTSTRLHHDLTCPRSVKLDEATIALGFHLYVLPGTEPPKPGLIDDPAFTSLRIAVDVLALAATAFEAFIARIQATLGICKMTMTDSWPFSGLLCEAHVLKAPKEVAAFGSWSSFRVARA